MREHEVEWQGDFHAIGYAVNFSNNDHGGSSNHWGLNNYGDTNNQCSSSNRCDPNDCAASNNRYKRL